MTAPRPLLEIEDLSVDLPTDEGLVRPVAQLSLRVNSGEIVGLVGESGCGKSMTALAVMRLLPDGGRTEGQVRFHGQDLLATSEAEMRGIRGRRISMVFQDPMTSLDPVFTIGQQVAETVQAHRRVGHETARAQALEALEQVGLAGAAERMDNYPHQLSGGMRQRVMIAIALVMEPDLLIADEPTTALDVTIQAQILQMITDLQRRVNLGVLLISHDLAVVGQIADRVAVMYSGEIVETLPTTQLFQAPRHPYTQALLRCVPGMTGEIAYLDVIEGQVPELTDLPPACRFAPRCPHALDRCRDERPRLERVANEHQLRCWNPQPFQR